MENENKRQSDAMPNENWRDDGKEVEKRKRGRVIRPIIVHKQILPDANKSTIINR